MNPSFPDWNIEAEFPVPHQKKPLGLDHELVELLWENGQVVLHSQTHRKAAVYDPIDSRQQVDKHDQSTIQVTGSCENPTTLIHDNETVSWINCQIDDDDNPFEREFPSNFLPDIQLPNPNSGETQKQLHRLDDENLREIDPSNFGANQLLAPRFQTFNSTQQSNNLRGVTKFPNIPSPQKADLGSSKMMRSEVREHSMRTVGSSHCGSNQVAVDADASRASSCGFGNHGLSAAIVKDYGGKLSSQNEKGERETQEQAITSSSGGSGTSFGRTCTSNDSLKRKSRDAEDSECQSKAAVLESVAKKKSASKSGTAARKSRAAEVHNLSERRRRDRINEKMKALQELLPHSNKSDKASMLDEAIEYMKSLQLQLQMMWMGSGMAPLMFPSVQHYMSRVGMGIGPPTLPSIPNPLHLPRLPLVDQTMNVATPPNQAAMINSMNYQNQLQNSNFSEQYASYLGFHPMQSNSQLMNIFGLGSNMSQQNQNNNNLTPPPPSNTNNGLSAG